MNFRYTALGSDNQKFTGSLQAVSLESAREKLHKMDLSIIALEEANEEVEMSKPATPSFEEKPKVTVSDLKKKTPAPTKAPEKTINTFYFVAQNPQGKEVNGTIDATDEYSAFKRLVAEYKFQVTDFYVHGEEDNPQKSMEPSFEAWNQQLTREGISPITPTDSEVTATNSGPVMATEVVQEIDYFIKSTKNIIQTHQEEYSKPFLVELEKKLGNLERIRTSNNLNHITKVCNDIYKLISHPELAEGKSDEEREAAYQQAVQDLSQSGFIQRRADLFGGSDKGGSPGLGGIKKIFGRIEGKLAETPKPPPSNTPLASPSSSSGQKTVFDPTLFKGKISVGMLFKSYFTYLKEGNPILRRARKQEFDRLYRNWKAKKQKAQEDKAKLETKEEVSVIPKESINVKKDYSDFFIEVDSFVGWLIFFYVSYFFLASFSLERNIGLSQDLVIQTLSSPLIINIFIFLLLAHLTLKLKLRLFHQNGLGSGMLFFLSLTLYIVLLANF